jgi:cobalamin biosynthesis Mg chelatase CobN
MPENINQHLMSRGSNGQTRIVQYTPAQQARRTRASFEKGDEPPVADTITTQATNDTQPSGGDENADPKENHTGDVLGDDVSTTADTGTTMAILPASKKSTATTTTATTTATNSNSNPDAGQPPQAIMIVTLVAVLLLIVLVAATWFIIPKVSRIYIRHDKSPFGLAAEAAHTPPPPRASAGNNNIVVHPSTATLTQRIVPARTNITYGI